MKEGMRRLIKGSKIVGRNFLCSLKVAEKLISAVEFEEFAFAFRYHEDSMINIYSYDGENWTFLDNADYTSFDMGVKVGNEWIFENDIIKWETEDYEIWDGETIPVPTTTLTGKLVFNTGMEIERLSWKKDCYFYSYDGQEFSWCDLKPIGTIYDKEPKEG